VIENYTASHRGRVRAAALLTVLAGFALAAHAAVPPHAPGTLANPGFEGQPMKSMFFFPGQWRGVVGEAFYAGPDPSAPPLAPATNAFCNYTAVPVDGWMNLGWSDNIGGEKREHAVDLMLAAGVNVVNMSYWGPPNVDRWAFWAPMHSAPRANEELFDQAVGKPVLIAPYIEDGASTQDNEKRAAPDDPVEQTGCHFEKGPKGQSPAYRFVDTFPGTAADPAPRLVEQIVDLIDRFLLRPKNKEWPAKWAQMYDRDGKPRYVVSLIHVASNQENVSDETFAKGFGWVADRIYALRGVRVGFTLDALPPDHNAVFKPSPKKTGPFLAKQRSVLAIQPFIPEVFRGFATGLCRDAASGCDARDGLSPQLGQLLQWKRDFISGWVGTGIPVILDVSSGYDAHLVFAADNPPRYGNNVSWRLGQEEMLNALGVRGITGNAWNGYTEALAFVPSCVFRPAALPGPPALPTCQTDAVFVEGRKAFDWFRALTPAGGTEAKLPTKLGRISPDTAAYSDPVTLQVQLTSLDLDQALFSHPPVRTAVSGRVVRLRVGKQQVQVTTDASGSATATLVIDERPSAVPLPVLASFDGDSDFLAIEAPRSSIRVIRESTSIRWFGDVGTGHGRVLAAQLRDDDGRPVRKRVVAFTAASEAGTEKCTGVTDAGGIARCKIRLRAAGGETVLMVFAGDAYYEPATGSRTSATISPAE
jgi:hypothetical protein